jgi:branched-chain amino acid transport system ATP-binding protein
MALCEALGMGKRFGGVAALQGVSLRLEPAAITALIGPNGSGKTTLLGLLGGQLRPSAGAVRWRGEDITRWPAHRRCRAGIARTFQVAQPFLDLSLLENVRVGVLFGAPAGPRSRHEVTARARQLLEELGLASRADTRAGNLSLGDLKRLELAMALSTQPSLLLVDEILAAQSPASVESLLAYLGALRTQGLAILLVEHRLQALRRTVDHVVALHQGRIISEGTPDGVLRHPAVTEAYLGEPLP